MLAKFSYAATWHVGKHQNIKTIQQAINQCKNGDTVIVEAGNYFEKNLIVNKSIVLLGIDYPVLDGEKKYEIISVNKMVR